ncbi:Isoquinoline 1-oxidoreductase subunit beta [Thalassocella blandensis]|nr:Isoquinoline 1-oxidoreductase subunit beta [Thalassocella blandensis]
MDKNFDASRRKFILGSSAVAFAVLATGAVTVLRNDPAKSRETIEPETLRSIKVDAWVSIDSNNVVTIHFPSTEMGQGIMTSQPMIFAEELDADWSKVIARQIDQGPLETFGNPHTGGILFTAGSSSIEGYFTKLRMAGANVRRILLYTAATVMGVPVTDLVTEKSEVIHPRSGQRLTYAAIANAGSMVTNVPAITEADLKPREEWRIIGRDQNRLDIPAKTLGETVYSIDVRVADMVYATQALAPVEGETPLQIEDGEARRIKGIIDILPLKNSVAVVATTFEAAIEARNKLQITWSQTSPFRGVNSQQELADTELAAKDLNLTATAWENRGNAVAALHADAENVVYATYTTEHVYHAQMEPLCAVANVDEDEKGAEVWLGTQSQTLSIGAAAQALQTTPDRIRFHAMQMGGAFGRRTFFARDLLVDAIHISRAVKRPVKLMWTREDDVKNGWLRPATAHHLSATLDKEGRVKAMRHRVASPSIFEFAAPQRWANAKGRDLLVMEGTESSEYDIPDFLAEHVLLKRQSRVSAWRGIGWGINCYARECFIDELALKAGQNPLDFRRRLLQNSPRSLKLLDEVTQMSDFGNAPNGRAHGLAFAGYKSTLGAGVAEVSRDPNTGKVKVHKFWAAVDPGIVIHPHNYIAQTEGGIIFGLSGLMRERVSFVNGEIEQQNFYDYEVMRIGDVPQIKVNIVESGEAPSGAGEIGVPMTGGAVANAFRALTGEHLRHMPFG